MKSPLLIGVSALALLTLGATLFAQTTTGSSLITEMKAAVRNFTLAGDLNPGVTGLQSAPVSGKKTGDMLTAGEYNRILELVGQGGGGGGSLKYHQANISVPAGTVNLDTLPGLPAGYVAAFINSCTTGGTYMDTIPMAYINNNVNTTCGGIMAAPGTHTFLAVGTSYFILSGYFTFEGGGGGGGGTGGGSSGWVDVPLTDTNPFDQQCMYRFVTQGQTYYAETVHEDKLYWINSQHFTKTNKSVLVFGTAPYNTATKMEKFCGGGGGGGGFNWDMCVPEWVGTPTNGTPYTNAAGLKCKYTGTGPGAPGTNYYYLCCPGA